ncbi:MAG: hypothetical protein IPH20_12725 [Bacteroidales bacterium]|nr:hypothetical protein [Bacteroidales bacterium]
MRTSMILPVNKKYQQCFDAQILSGKQTSQAIERDEIQQITLLKGGFSCCFTEALWMSLLAYQKKNAF